jgi:TonB family protein
LVPRSVPNGPAAVLPPKHFKPVLAQPAARTEGELGYVPAGVISVVYPEYPVNSVAWGSVVVQVSVNAEGKAESPDVLYGRAPFKDLALKALEKWRFQPETMGGEAVPSQTAVAFVFQTPIS